MLNSAEVKRLFYFYNMCQPSLTQNMVKRHSDVLFFAGEMLVSRGTSQKLVGHSSKIMQIPHGTTGVCCCATTMRLLGAGGPRPGETVDSWTARQIGRRWRRLQVTTGNGQEERGPALGSPETRFSPKGGVYAVSPGRSPALQEGGVDRLVQEQVCLIPGLETLTRDNPIALGNIELVLKAAFDGGFYPDEPGGAENRRELERLVPVIADLGEIV